jgi:hypothetical protein
MSGKNKRYNPKKNSLKTSGYNVRKYINIYVEKKTA